MRPPIDQNNFLTYIDSRPLIILVGISLAILGIAFTIIKWKRYSPIARGVLIAMTPSFVILYLLLFTDKGPFVGQVETVTKRMNWVIATGELGKQPDPDLIVISFPDSSGFQLREKSPELRAYLVGLGESEVDVKFRLIKDYGRIRSISVVKIGELEKWASEKSYVIWSQFSTSNF